MSSALKGKAWKYTRFCGCTKCRAYRRRRGWNSRECHLKGECVISYRQAFRITSAWAA